MSKELPKGSKRYVVPMTSGQYSQVVPLVVCGKIYKGETGRPLKVRLEEHRKAVVRGEIEKSGMADHIWKEKGNHLPLWDKVEISDRAKHWRIRPLKESAHVGLQ